MSNRRALRYLRRHLATGLSLTAVLTSSVGNEVIYYSTGQLANHTFGLICALVTGALITTLAQEVREGRREDAASRALQDFVSHAGESIRVTR